MVDSICDWLLKKIMTNDPSIDEEKSEIIYYGLQNIIGELPKGIFILIAAWMCGVLDLVLIGTIPFLIYRGFAGGVHLKTHISCLIISILLIVGSAFLAKNVLFENPFYIYTTLMLFNLSLAILYAPADTENRPIMKDSQRKRQKIESISMIIFIYLLSMFVIKEQSIASLNLYMLTVESFMITPIAYKLFDNKSGEERRNEILKSM